jgi:hypothetical protein
MRAEFALASGEGAIEKSDSPYPLALLRARRKGPRHRRAANKLMNSRRFIGSPRGRPGGPESRRARLAPPTNRIAYLSTAGDCCGAGFQSLCLSQIKSGCSDDATRPRSAGGECGQPPGQRAVSAHLCSMTNVCASRCNISCTTAAGDGGATPQAPRRGQRIPFGSSRSDVPHIHFATVIAATPADLGCPSRGHAG